MFVLNSLGDVKKNGVSVVSSCKSVLAEYLSLAVVYYNSG